LKKRDHTAVWKKRYIILSMYDLKALNVLYIVSENTINYKESDMGKEDRSYPIWDAWNVLILLLL